MGFEDIIETELRNQKRLNESAERQLDRSVKGTLWSKTRPDGREQFYVKVPGESRPRYINLEHLEDLRMLVDKKYAGVLQEATRSNIDGLEFLQNVYRSVKPEDILDSLPKAYQEAKMYLKKHGYDDEIESLSGDNQRFTPSQKPTRKEGLIHRTSFGLLVRSKGEVLIAEILYSRGIWVYYEFELGLQTEGGGWTWVYPDFRIDLGDGKSIIWEHKGKYGDPEYFQSDMWKMSLYYMNGIYEPVNLIVTCDGPDGSTDMEAIRRIVDGVIMPQMKKDKLFS